MEFVKTQIARLQEQLKTLTATQKMLAGTLVVIILMTLYGWSNFASKAEMEPLLNVSLNAEDMGEIQKQLASAGIKYKVVGDRIEVPSDRKLEAVGMLGYAQALPRDMKNAFADMIAKSNPFSSTQEQTTRYNIALQDVLGQVMRHFPRVRNAMVIINPGKERAFTPAEPSATVYLNMRSKVAPDQKLVNAAADVVAGAAALKRENVKVIVDETAWPVHGTDELGGMDADTRLEMVRRNEKYLRESLMSLFAYIDGVRIDVSVKPNLERKETKTSTPDATKKVQIAVVEETTNEETKAAAAASGEPGMVINGTIGSGAATGGEGGGGTHEKTRTEYLAAHGQSDTHIIKPPGDVEIIAASMLVPRSYFAQVLKKKGASEKEPDEAAVEKFAQAELTKLKAGLKTKLGLATDEAVYVDAYTDIAPLAMANPQAVGTSIASLATDHVKEIALGVLALVSLFMVSNMVKKPAAPPAPPPVQAMKATHLLGTEEMVGEAEETSPVLDGVELDDDSVKAQQMVSQVSNLVGENPDAAASLVKRWLTQQ